MAIFNDKQFKVIQTSQTSRKNLYLVSWLGKQLVNVKLSQYFFGFCFQLIREPAQAVTEIITELCKPQLNTPLTHCTATINNMFNLVNVCLPFVDENNQPRSTVHKRVKICIADNKHTLQLEYTLQLSKAILTKTLQ